MRLYELLNFQHIMLYLLPTLVFIVLFGLLLGYRHLKCENSEKRTTEIVERFPGGIEGRDAPFPVGVTLIIAGSVIWGFLYILFYGLLEIRI